MEEFSELMETDNMMAGLDPEANLVDLIVRFCFNLLVVFGLSRFLYYPQRLRRDYMFVFMIISISIFLMVYLLGTLKLKIGFALGLFAIFGIVKYRTEQLPVREMTYLFVIISLSVINALSRNIGLGQLVISNALLIIAIWTSEKEIGLKDIRSKIIMYDEPKLVKPTEREALKEDLRTRLGLDVQHVEVGHIDFTRDVVTLRVFYINHDNKH